MTTHKPVLLDEALQGLAIKPDGIYLDGTFGRGGHSKAILKALSDQGKLFAMDKDSTAVAYAHQHFGGDSRFHMAHSSFANVKEFATVQGIEGRVDGILLDLGVSSPQLDDPARGFSFMHSGPLDMRMDISQAIDASKFVNEADVQDLVTVFRNYGEERYANRIAKAIVAARAVKPISTTEALAQIVKDAHPKWEKHKHPATRVFQAIRIYVNQELQDLSACLQQCMAVLAPHGRLVVISFHSLEDRIVKRFMQALEQGVDVPREIPLRYEDKQAIFKRIGKAVMPQAQEITNNVRARSAVLRIGEKLA